MYDQHRYTNMNNKDRLVGQLTSEIWDSFPKKGEWVSVSVHRSGQRPK